MKKHIRKSLLIGSAMLAAGSAYAQVQVEQVGTVSIYLRDAEALSKLSGEELRDGLVKNLRVKPDARVENAQLYMVRVEKGQVKHVFVSDIFSSDPKEVGDAGFFPGDMYFPGDMFFPGDMYFPGEIYFPGDMYYPTKDRKSAVSKAAEATFGRASRKNGWFFIVIADQGMAQSSGIAIASEEL